MGFVHPSTKRYVKKAKRTEHAMDEKDLQIFLDLCRDGADPDGDSFIWHPSNQDQRPLVTCAGRGCTRDVLDTTGW